MGAEGVRSEFIRFNLSGKRTENLYVRILGSFCAFPESNHFIMVWLFYLLKRKTDTLVVMHAGCSYKIL
jgi:hypothetical protein